MTKTCATVSTKDRNIAAYIAHVFSSKPIPINISVEYTITAMMPENCWLACKLFSNKNSFLNMLVKAGINICYLVSEF